MTIFLRKIFGIILFFKGGGTTTQIGPKDVTTFRNVMVICVIGVGGVSSLIFHVIVKPTGKTSTNVSKTYLHANVVPRVPR